MLEQKRLRVGVLISGRGSNLQALLDACQDPTFPAEIVLVLANKADAYGLERARLAGVRTAVVTADGLAGREAHERAIDAELQQCGVDVVAMAGYMRLLTPWFVRRWHDRLINIHPSLLPSFKGLHTHEAALAAGVRFHGCTVHYVRTEMDVGPIIVQAAVPVLASDTPEALAQRVLTAEHQIYPLAVRLIAEGRVSIVDERVEIAQALPGAISINPAP
jgi:phosphoribosylglycinamide formyltransferase 1